MYKIVRCCDTLTKTIHRSNFLSSSSQLWHAKKVAAIAGINKFGPVIVGKWNQLAHLSQFTLFVDFNVC